MLFSYFRYCFTVIPNFKDIYWRKRYPNINFTMTFIENRNIDYMIWNYIILCTKCKVYAWHRIIYNMSWFINNLSISWWGCEKVNFLDVSNIIFHQLEQRALKSPVTMEHIGNSSFILLKSKSKFTQKISNLSWLWLGER